LFASGLTASLLLIGSSFYLSPEMNKPVVAMVGLSLFMAFHGIGIGPISRLIPAEVFDTSIRAKALVVSGIINRGTAALMSATLLTLSDYLSWSAVFFMLAGVCAFIGPLLYCYLPETSGYSLEFMSRHFAEATNDSAVMEAERKLRGDNSAKDIDSGGYYRRQQLSSEAVLMRLV
jgi:predicted MFS family arabinose efflux permease